MDVGPVKASEERITIHEHKKASPFDIRCHMYSCYDTLFAGEVRYRLQRQQGFSHGLAEQGKTVAKALASCLVLST